MSSVRGGSFLNREYRSYFDHDLASACTSCFHSEVDMERERSGMEPGGIPVAEGAEWAAFVQQQVQIVLQVAIPHIVQQVADRAVGRPSLGSPTPSEDVEVARRS